MVGSNGEVNWSTSEMWTSQKIIIKGNNSIDDNNDNDDIL
jgi:hypothetical protein